VSLPDRLAGQVPADRPAWWMTPATMGAHLTQGRWIPAPHLRLIAMYLVALAWGWLPTRRLMVLAPPRHGKSELCSHWFPLWHLAWFPDQPIILTSHTGDFAAGWGRAVRDSADLYGEHWPDLRIRGDANAANRWLTTAGGGMRTAGIGGPITGTGAAGLIIDDPLKDDADAQSRATRERQKRWWQSTARTRLLPGAWAMLIMTRWHPDDIGGWLSATQGDRWTIVRLPAIADGMDGTGEHQAPDHLGRALGDPLWPGMWPASELEQTRMEVGEYVFGGMYLGLPRAQAGRGLWTDWHFDRAEQGGTEAFKDRAPEPGDFPRVVVAVDPPGGKTDCGIIVAGRQDRAGTRTGVVLEDCTMTGRPRAEDWAQAAVEAYYRWKADEIIAETNYGGDMVRATIQAHDDTVPVRVVTATRGKRVRAEPIQALYGTPNRPDDPLRILHAGPFHELRTECTTYQPDSGMESPNRMDALVWALQGLGLTQRRVRTAPNPLR
jgi:hypothetical protein